MLPKLMVNTASIQINVTTMAGRLSPPAVCNKTMKAMVPAALGTKPRNAVTEAEAPSYTSMAYRCSGAAASL